MERMKNLQNMLTSIPDPVLWIAAILAIVVAFWKGFRIAVRRGNLNVIFETGGAIQKKSAGDKNSATETAKGQTIKEESRVGSKAMKSKTK